MPTAVAESATSSTVQEDGGRESGWTEAHRASEPGTDATTAANSSLPHVPRQLAAPVPPGWRRWAPKVSARHLVLGHLLAAVAVVACWWAWVDAWSLVDAEGDNGHVLLAPLVIAWLVWVRRRRLPHIRVTGRPFGPLTVLLGWVMLSYGEADSVSSLYHLGALLIAVGALISVAGKGIILRFMPAAFALLFLIPVPGRVRENLAVPLQVTTARLASGVINAVGGEVRVAGNTLLVEAETPTGPVWRDVTVAEACNGMPMALGLLVVTYAFAFAWPLRNRYRWLLLLLSPIVTLACNVARTVPLVWAFGQATDVPGDPWRHTADLLHTWSGWLMLPVAFLLLAGLVRLLKWCDLRVERYRLAA